MRAMPLPTPALRSGLHSIPAIITRFRWEIGRDEPRLLLAQVSTGEQGTPKPVLQCGKGDATPMKRGPWLRTEGQGLAKSFTPSVPQHN